MFLILFARYKSHLLSELSFFTAWDETVHMAASHGVTAVRLPPTKVRASVPQSSAVQLAFEIPPEESSSYILHHSSTPFTSQNNVFDFLSTMRRDTSWVIPRSRNTQVVLTAGEHPSGRGWGAETPPKTEIKKNTDFVHITISKFLFDLPFSRNQPLKSTDDSTLEF
jgi:hypothetical protein